MKKIMVILCILLLVGCGSNAHIQKDALSDYRDFTSSKLSTVDEKWAEFEADIEAFQNGEVTKEETVKSLRQYKVKLSKISTDIYEYEFQDKLDDEFKNELIDSRDALSEAVFERAKATGHYRRYLDDNDQISKEQFAKRIQKSEEEFEKYLNIIEGLEDLL